MYIRIRDVNRKPNGHLYVHSDQWESRADYSAGLPALRCTSYETNRTRGPHSRIVTNADGNLIAANGTVYQVGEDNDGLPIDDSWWPTNIVWERETYYVDLMDAIRMAIKDSFLSMIEQGLVGCYCADRCGTLLKHGVLIGGFLGPYTDLSVVREDGLTNVEMEVPPEDMIQESELRKMVSDAEQDDRDAEARAEGFRDAADKYDSQVVKGLLKMGSP